jgi:hypothetical protein
VKQDLVMRFIIIFLILMPILDSSNISLAGGYKSKRSGQIGYLKKDLLNPDLFLRIEFAAGFAFDLSNHRFRVFTGFRFHLVLLLQSRL